MLKRLLFVTLFATLPSALFAMGQQVPSGTEIRMPRVRPNDSRSAALLLEGMERSPRLRRIVDQLERSRVIVYVEMSPGMKGNLGGKLTWVANAGGFRYVRISLNPALLGDALIATLGHELQHALEVSGAEDVIDAASLAAHYKRNGFAMPGHANGWDTEAARVAGDEVRRELGDSPTSRVTASLRRVRLEAWPDTYRRARRLLPAS